MPEADGVFRGGGVKGLGLAGTLLGFAEHKTYPITTWRSVAGASAGAIIACWLAVKGGDAVNLGVDAKTMLVNNGKAAAKRFLDDFDPRQYQNTYGTKFTR